MRPLARVALLALASLALSPVAALAQAQPTQVKDSAPLRPPAGSRVAIVTFEDLECPACAHAFPILEQAREHYKIPIVFYDFPLNMHIWSRDAAVIARYIQDTISRDAADQYRAAIFRNQMNLSSKEDLQAFTQKYFQDHGRTMPFVLDPTGKFAREVEADYELGQKVNVNHTPTIFVVTPNGYKEVMDVSTLYSTIDSAEASVPAGSGTTSKLRKSSASAR